MNDASILVESDVLDTLRTSKLLPRLINVGLRGSTLVSKFLLIFLLARFLEPAEVGLYGLLVATVSYALYFLGFDFYVFTTREIIKASPDNRGRLLKSQVGLCMFLYIVFLPLSLSLFAFELLPWWLAPWFISLLVLEHINQELNRLLVALNRQLIASLVLFFRAGAWALIVVLVLGLNENLRSLSTVVGGWLMGGTVAVLLGFAAVAKAGMGGWTKKIDWMWVRKGLRVALPMLISSIALRGLFTLDRYWFEAWVSLEALGAYVLFMGIATAMQSFMDAAVFTFLYPGMISAHASGEPELFRQKHKQMVVQTVLLLAVFSGVAMAAIGPIVSWLDRPIYLEHIDIFMWVLVANVLFILGALPQYALYAQNFDRPIIFNHLIGFLVFVVATALVGVADKSAAVPIGLCCACGYLFLSKTYAFYKLTPNNWRLIIFPRHYIL